MRRILRLLLPGLCAAQVRDPKDMGKLSAKISEFSIIPCGADDAEAKTGFFGCYCLWGGSEIYGSVYAHVTLYVYEWRTQAGIEILWPKSGQRVAPTLTPTKIRTRISGGFALKQGYILAARNRVDVVDNLETYLTDEIYLCMVVYFVCSGTSPLILAIYP